MKARKSQSYRRSHSRHGSHLNNRTASYSSCTSLVWIDASPFLENERRLCLQTEKKIEAIQHQIDKHIQIDQPAYQSWLYSNYGPALSQLRDLENQYFEHASLIEKVEQEAFYSRISKKRAYEKVIASRSNNDNKTEEANESTAEERSESSGESHDSFKEEMYKFFDELFGDDSDEDDEFYDGAGPSHQPRDASSFQSPKNASRLSQLKKIYRELARSLHPDLNPGLPAKDLQLWHEVQAAYQNQDLERLESLAAQSSNGELQNYRSVQSLGRLRMIGADLRMRLLQLGVELRQLKKIPSWNFSKTLKNPKKLQKLTNKIDDELHSSLHEYETRIESMRATVLKWQKQPSNKTVRKQSNSKSTPSLRRSSTKDQSDDFDQQLGFEMG